MACLYSVKQKNNVRGTYLQRNNLWIKLRMLITYIFFPEISYRVNLCCELDNFQKISLYFRYVLLLLKNCLTTIPVAICQLFAFTCKEHWQGLPLSSLDPVSPFDPFSP